MHKQITTLTTIFIFALSALTCTKTPVFDNPLDSDATLDSPSDVQVISLTEIFVNLSWKFSTKYPSFYKQYIERSSDNVNYFAIDSVDATVNTKIVSAIFYGNTNYTFRIRASVGNNRYATSSPVAKLYDFPAPTNLQITAMTTTQVNLQWTNTNTFATSLDIEQSTNGTTFTVVKNVAANVTTTTITGTFDSTTTYYFRAKAKSQYNTSPASNAPSYNIAAAAAAGITLVGGGTLNIGSNTYSNEQPIHSVTISDFYISTTEIRWGMWDTVRAWGLNNGYSDLPAGRKGYNGDATHPVTEVNWYDVVKWCNARSQKEGLTPVYYTSSSFTTANIYKTGQIDLDQTMVNYSANGYRLPTEAEWEYAARGGIKTQNYTYSGSNTIDNVAWYSSNSGTNTHTVGTKTKNELGLYDMSGNVWEWVEDWYHTSYNGAPSDGKAWYPKDSNNPYRVLRGGSFYNDVYYCRVAYRVNLSPSNRFYSFGFRVLRKK